MLSTYLGQYISVQLSENIVFNGIFIDVGTDCLILSECDHYHYLPFRHIQQITFPDCPNEPAKLGNGKTSFRKSLMNAKGRNVRVLLGENTELYGYIMSIMNNYFVFFSPIYHTVFISMDHVKSVTFDEVEAYGQNKKAYPSSTLTLSRTFEEQLEKLIGQFVVFDSGDAQQKIGKLCRVEHGLVSLISAYGDEFFLTIQHLKCVHVQ